MKGVYLLVLAAISAELILCEQKETLKPENHNKLKLINNKKPSIKRKLGVNKPPSLYGEITANQLGDTNSFLEDMKSQKQIKNVIKKMTDHFGIIDERLDNYREAYTKKFNELHMKLQSPKMQSYPGNLNMNVNPMNMAEFNEERSNSNGFGFFRNLKDRARYLKSDSQRGQKNRIL